MFQLSDIENLGQVFTEYNVYCDAIWCRISTSIKVVAHMLKRWWGLLEKRRMATESGGDETATRPGTRPAVPGTRPATRRRRRLVMNETAVTGGVMYTDEGELEFDEDEMAALEGQRLVAEFRCGIY